MSLLKRGLSGALRPAIVLTVLGLVSTATIAPASAVSPLAATTTDEVALTPKNVEGGQIPSGYSRVVFTLSNGNWNETFTLPIEPTDGSVVEVRNNAAYATTLASSTTDIGISPTVRTGQSLTFTYAASSNWWTVSGTMLTRTSPKTVGDAVPSTTPYTYYRLANGDWTGGVALPSDAADGNIIIIASTATWKSAVLGENVLHASTTSIHAGDIYHFRFIVDEEAGTRKWVLTSAPTRTVDPVATVPTPTSPRTAMTLTDEAWLESVSLPAKAADRDRVTLRSSATKPTRILASSIEASGNLTLTKGTEYTLMYVADRSLWVVLDAPDTVYTPKSLSNGVLPALTTPRTLVTTRDGDWAETLTLPTGSTAGSHVVVKANSTWAVKVRTGITDVPVRTGETVAFTADASGNWVSTVTIDLLLLYSKAASAAFGEATMRTRLTEGLTLTNETLENSGANFRYRAVGLREFDSPATWTALGDPLSELRDDTTAQAWRDETKADGIYYEGLETGCGLAWVSASAYNMVATGSTTCGTNVMRHELGHNMGLRHAKESTAPARGYAAVKSVMGGNAIPYFSTPFRYDPTTGMALGIPGKIDAVSAMNERSATVAAFR